MRVLVISPFPPHPEAGHGGAVYLGQLLAGMRTLPEAPELHILHFQHAGDGASLDGVAATAVPRRRVPEMGGLERLRSQLGHLWSWGLRGRPLEICKHDLPAMRQALRRVLAEFRPDAVMLEFAVMSWCLEELAGFRVLLTDHEAGESVPRSFGPGSLCIERDRRLWRAWVAQMYPQAALLQAVTEEDAAQLQQQLGRAVQVRPVAIALPPEAVAPQSAGPVMLFFGDHRHHPNPEAVLRLAAEVLPSVRAAVPEVELWVAGADPDGRLAALAGQAGLRLLGFVEDLPTLLGQARLLLAPLWSGRGIRVKSLQAMAHGLPLVSNALGLQGIAPPAGLVSGGESAEDLAEAAVQLLREPEAAARAGAAQRAYVAEKFGIEAAARDQCTLLGVCATVA